MIQLTSHEDNVQIWINPRFIICFYKSDHSEGGSNLAIVDADEALSVKESPSDILHKIEKMLQNGWGTT